MINIIFMQPVLIKVNISQESSFSVNRYLYEDKFPGIWQFHDEYELTLILQSNGTRIVGDHIDRFKGGDLVFVGKNSPHTWRNDNENSFSKAEALVVHFLENFLGNNFFDAPEMKKIKLLLQKSKRGLSIVGNTRRRIEKLLLNMENTSGAEKLITFLTILHILSDSAELIELSSEGFAKSINQSHCERLSNVYAFIMNNFQNEIHLGQAAAVANMSPTAFSRYFKNRTRQSFSSFLINIRIGYACKLLMNEDRTVSQACYECGFQNLSNFNQQFKEHIRLTPKKYQLLHMG